MSRRKPATGPVRADLGRQPQQVAAMFDDVAAGYDRANTVMTLGLDHRWRLATARILGASRGEKVLDLAAGTGVSTAAYAAAGAWCVAADFSLGMLRAGRHRTLPMVAADALHLPFAAGTFDAAAVSLGIRNFVDPKAALVELARVVRPGGRLVICELSTPPSVPIRFLHRRVLLRAMTRLGRRFSSHPNAYGYLAESVLDWPAQRELALIIAGAGWRDVEWTNLTFGIVAVHTATKA